MSPSPPERNSSSRRFARVGDAAGRGTTLLMAPRPDRRAEDEKLIDPRTEHVRRIAERVERAEYRVDAPAVAEAIVRRLLEGGRVVPAATSAAGPSTRND